jgi:hypothetical protein
VPRSLYYKTFLLSQLIYFRNKLLFVPGKPFQPSLMFAGKSGAYPSEAPCRYKHASLLIKKFKDFEITFLHIIIFSGDVTIDVCPNII